MKNIEWLFFDIGSTLVDETECYNSRINYAIESKNLNRQEFLSKVYECAKTSATAIKSACAFYNIELPKWDNSLEKLYIGTKNVLEELSQKYKLGIIANQSTGTTERLDNWEIGKYFDVIISSTEEGCSKPDLKIFNLAVERAKCNPENAIMIGDRLDNDIIPAKQLGMQTVWIRQGFAKYQYLTYKDNPNIIIENLGELLNYIKDEKFVSLVDVTEENIDYYTNFELSYAENLSQYMTRIKPDKDKKLIRWCYICLDNFKIGSAWLEQYNAESAKLGIFIADEKYRNHGYGKLAVEQMLKYAKNTSFKSVVLNVRENNYKSYQFYKNNGFIEIDNYIKSNGVPVIKLKYDLKEDNFNK